MKTTPNMGLNKPELTDVFDHKKFLADNFDILDTKAASKELLDQTLRDMQTVNANAELQAARGGEALLGDRLAKVDSSLAEIATYVNADRTGLTSASTAINNLIANANDGDEIHFHSGTYLIDSPIAWNKKVSLIADGKVTLKASTAIDSIIKATGFTSYTEVQLPRFFLDGNHLANYCITLDGTANYVAKIHLKSLDCRNAVLDGIQIIPPAWSIKVEDCLSNSHGRDGIRSIMTSNPAVNQINHVEFENCTFNDNVANGVNVLGVAINLKHCDIENNNIGVNIDASTITYASFHINIQDGCYIEGNKTNQINAVTNTGDGIVLNVDGNYINPANLGGASIKCAGIAEGITLYLGENRFESSSSNIILDGGNALSSKSLITKGIYLNEDKFINLGLARVIQDLFGTVMLPATLSTAPSNAVHVTDDLMLHTPQKVEYSVPIDLQFKLLKLLQAKIVTNATSYNLTCTVNVIDLTGTVIQTISYTITGTANQTWGVYLTNDWGYYRVPKEHFVTVSFLVNSISASSYITINNVALSCI